MTATSPSGRERASALRGLAALLLTVAALLALIRAPATNGQAQAPPALISGPAVYRADGGQAITEFGRLPANSLTKLNLGRQINLTETRPELLSALPGLGEKSAAKARQRGCLNARELRYNKGFISESCDRNNP